MIWLDKLDGAATQKSQSEMIGFFIFCHSKDLENKGILRKNNSHNELDNPFVTVKSIILLERLFSVISI